MKICSFLPAVTQMIYDLGLQDLLLGVTFECPESALLEKSKVVRCVLEGKNYSSIEIDKIYAASKAEGRSLYYVDEELLQRIQPDVIFTQDVCEVCQIDTACTMEAVSKLTKKPKIISVSPSSFKDVLDSVITIARVLNAVDKGYLVVNEYQKRLNYISDQLRVNNLMHRRAMIMEWMKPIYNCGHWIPDQIAWAGGVDMLSNPGGDSINISWEKVLKYDPHVLVIAPCGFDIKRSESEISLLTERPGWYELTAVRNNEVYICDFAMFTQPSASTLMEGVEVLARIF